MSNTTASAAAGRDSPGDPMRGVAPGARFPHAVPLAVLFFFLTVAVASWSAIRLLLADAPISPTLNLYNRTVLAFDYFHSGFVRRGLGGAVASLFGDVAEPLSALWFHMFSAAFLALPVTLLVAKLATKVPRRTLLFYALFMLVSPHLCRSWSQDLARTDLLVCGLIAWAALAMIYARPYLAVVLLVTGSLVHETALIFGVPLAAAIGFVAYRNGTIARPAIVRSCALLLISLALIGLALNFAASPERLAAFASGVRAKLPARQVVDLSLYIQLSGWRGLEASICANLFLRDRYWLYLPAMPGIIGIYLVAFGAQSRLSAMLFSAAAILPAIVISLVAMDLGRWACFGVFNVWLLAVAVTLMKPEWLRPLSSGFWKRVAVVALVCYVGKHGVLSPTWAVDAVANRIGIPSLWSGEVDACDPGWRDYLSSVLNPVRPDGKPR